MWRNDHAPARAALPDDAVRLREFGPPVFGFVPQPRLREYGWSWFALDGLTLEAQAHYWLADENGDFGFRETRAGQRGTALRGFVFTDIVGSTGGRDEPVHAALVQHLDYVEHNYQNSRFEPGTSQWIDHGQSRRAAIETAPVTSSTLTVVGFTPENPAGDIRSRDAMLVTTSNFSATTSVIDDRIVTVVIHHADRDQIDIRLFRRI